MNFCGQCGEPLKHNKGKSSAEKICTSCHWKWYANPVPVVVVLVTTQNGEMIYARQNWFPKGKWSVISGYVNKNETAEEAAIREVREETGLETEVVDYMGTIFSNDKPEELYLMYRSQVVGGVLQAGDDVTEVESGQISLDKLFEGTVGYKMVSDFLKLKQNLTT